MEPNVLAVYGILKLDFSLDLSKMGARYIGNCEMPGTELWKIGDGVGLIRSEFIDSRTHGQLFEIPEQMWEWLDRIEGHPYLYKRSLIDVIQTEVGEAGEGELDRRVWVYIYQHPDYFTEKIESGNYESDSEYARG